MNNMKLAYSKLRDKTGLPVSDCLKAVTLLGNLNQAYCYLILTSSGVLYKRPDGGVCQAEDLCAYIKKNVEESDIILDTNTKL